MTTESERGGISLSDGKISGLILFTFIIDNSFPFPVFPEKSEVETNFHKNQLCQ